ncbi:hypothetical protein ABZU32_13310 [Sphaerisporangium sp. NPDC005288]|uniref:hypothetical protein n=1 Tax=Sphaerisporangium sp. NPDC005288 TaxID=3155114 RepID=UPI0033A85BD1
MRTLTRLILPMVMVTATTATGCAGEGPRLALGQDPKTGETVAITVALPNTRAHRSYSLGSWVMCLDRPGSVTIDRIDLIKPQGGMVLQAFSSRPQSRTHEMLGNAEQPLTELGFPARSPAVTTPCAEEERNTVHTELGLQYGKTGDATASAEGVHLTYTSAGRQRTVDFSLTVELCAPGDMITRRCEDMYEEMRRAEEE